MPKTNQPTAKKVTKKAPKAPEVVASESAAASAAKPVLAKQTRNSSPLRKSYEGQALTVNVYSMDGKVIETMALPEAIFGTKTNPDLVAQAIRVYRLNHQQGTAMAKTRGQVTGSTKKMGRQKGSGRARHGSITAPIYVGGGKAHGPQPRDIVSTLPKKMRRSALFAALSAKLQEGNIAVMKGLDTMEPKTKVVAGALGFEPFTTNHKMARVLLVTPKAQTNVLRAARNLPYVDVDQAHLLHVYEVVKAQKVLFMPEAIQSLEETFISNRKSQSSSGKSTSQIENVLQD